MTLDMQVDQASVRDECFGIFLQTKLVKVKLDIIRKTTVHDTMLIIMYIHPLIPSAIRIPPYGTLLSSLGFSANRLSSGSSVVS